MSSELVMVAKESGSKVESALCKEVLLIEPCSISPSPHMQQLAFSQTVSLALPIPLH
jgi:hypothetical protein